MSFGDGRKLGDCAVVLGLAPSALRKLNLPEDALATFPSAFLQGMDAPCAIAPSGRRWRECAVGVEVGRRRQCSRRRAAVIRRDAGSARRPLRRTVGEQLRSLGHRTVMEIPFVDLPGKTATVQEITRAKLEPFGFVDGVSQPAIRGTYKALRGADPIHLVEAGEFILGYPDNRGNLPAGPTLDAAYDPGQRAADRDRAATRLCPADRQRRARSRPQRDLPRDPSTRAGRRRVLALLRADAPVVSTQQFPHWGGVRPEFVGAKLIGRWPDGSSVVRFPYQPGSEVDREQPLIRPGQGPVDVVEALLPQPELPPQPPAQPQAVSTTPSTRKVSVKFTRAEVREITAKPDNDFLFGAEDPQGLRCPFGAHIRRANPRESVAPGSQEQLAITNRHRILRVGPALSAGRQRTSGPVLHVPERRPRTPIRVRAADLAAGAVVSRTH